jgi:hypothetical protein
MSEIITIYRDKIPRERTNRSSHLGVTPSGNLRTKQKARHTIQHPTTMVSQKPLYDGKDEQYPSCRLQSVSRAY